MRPPTIYTNVIVILLCTFKTNLSFITPFKVKINSIQNKMNVEIIQAILQKNFNRFLNK